MTTYSDVVKSVGTAVNAQMGSTNKWVIAGRDVAVFFPDESALDAVLAGEMGRKELEETLERAIAHLAQGENSARTQLVAAHDELVVGGLEPAMGITGLVDRSVDDHEWLLRFADRFHLPHDAKTPIVAPTPANRSSSVPFRTPIPLDR